MSILSCSDVHDLAAGYVLDALEPDERSAVQAHLETCREPHPELAELGGVVPYLTAAVQPIEPATSLRARILAAVEAEQPGTVPGPSTAPGRRLPGLFTKGWPRALLAGAAMVILVLAGTTAYFGQQLAESRAYAATLARASTLAAVPGSLAIAISAAPGTGVGDVHGVAVIARDGTGIVVTDGLPQTRAPEVYEIWYVRGANAPIPAGSFQVDANGRGWIDGLSGAPGGAITLAITREAGPGATSPSLPILAAGSAGG